MSSNNLQSYLIDLYNQIDSSNICPICNCSLLKIGLYLHSDHHVGIYFNPNNKEKILDLYLNGLEYWIFPYEIHYYLVSVKNESSKINISYLKDFSINGIINLINKYHVFK